MGSGLNFVSDPEIPSLNLSLVLMLSPIWSLISGLVWGLVMNLIVSLILILNLSLIVSLTLSLRLILSLILSCRPLAKTRRGNSQTIGFGGGHFPIPATCFSRDLFSATCFILAVPGILPRAGWRAGWLAVKGKSRLG